MKIFHFLKLLKNLRFFWFFRFFRFYHSKMYNKDFGRNKVSKKFGHLGSCAWNMRFGCSDLTHAPRNGKMGVFVVKPLKVPHKECRKYPTRILVEDSEISGFSSSNRYQIMGLKQERGSGHTFHQNSDKESLKPR